MKLSMNQPGPDDSGKIPRDFSATGGMVLQYFAEVTSPVEKIPRDAKFFHWS